MLTIAEQIAQADSRTKAEAKTLSTETLAWRVELITKYPQMNSPSDWRDLDIYRAELASRA